MLDLVYEETVRIDSRFLEPACGDGNFLVEILRRKLEVIKKRYHDSQLEFERYCFQGVGSVYGVEILADNVTQCRSRLLDMVSQCYGSLYKKTARDGFMEVIAFVLARNILWGDALTLKKPHSAEPIVFSQWSFISGSLVKRTDYTFETLVKPLPLEGDTLTSDQGEEVFIPRPCRDFHPIHFLKVHDAVPHES